MHAKYAKDGLVVIAVSLDEATNKDRALKFLQKQKAAFPNYWLDEEVEDWQKHFDIASQPAQFIYGRDGKLARRINEEVVTHQELETLIEKLLRAGK